MADRIDDDSESLLESLVDQVRKGIEIAIDSQKAAQRSTKYADQLARELEKRTKKANQRPAPEKAVNPHDKSYDNFGESAMAIMLFMDIVEYSKVDSDEELKEWTDDLNKIVKAAIEKAGCDLDDVICLPSGDGMCLCFKDHKKPLKVAAYIHEALRGGVMKLRMGIHSGGVSRVTDLKGWFNLSGDAINMTQRAMDFGDEHHILCTRDAYKYFRRMRDDQNLFTALGKCRVKHDVELELYNYVCETRNVGNPEPPKKQSEDPAEEKIVAKPKRTSRTGAGTSH